MTRGSAPRRYAIEKPYDVALRVLRAALRRQGLYTPTELDVSLRIKQELGAGVAPCTVLYVDDPAVLLEAVVFHRGAALLIPQPLVITANDRHTEVLVRSPESLAWEMPETVREPLRDLLRRINRALDGIAENQSAHLALSCCQRPGLP